MQWGHIIYSNSCWPVNNTKLFITQLTHLKFGDFLPHLISHCKINSKVSVAQSHRKWVVEWVLQVEIDYSVPSSMIWQFPVDGQYDCFFEINSRSSISKWVVDNHGAVCLWKPALKSINNPGIEKVKVFLKTKSECFNWSLPWQLFNNLWNLKSKKWKWFWKNESCNRSSRGSDF